MSRTFNSTTDKMIGAAAAFTAPPGSLFGWVKRAAAGSFGRFYLSLGQSGVDTDKFLIGEEVSGPSGKAACYSYGGGFANGATTAIAVVNSVWHFVGGVISGTSSRSIFMDGTAKNTTTNFITNPATVNKTVISGAISTSVSSGIAGEYAHTGAIPRALQDLEFAYLEAHGNPNYLPHSGGSYWYVDQSGAEPDKWGSNTLTVTGTSAGADDPVIATFWTAAAFGNQSYTQGTAVGPIDLTTKFDNVHAPFTSAIQQLSGAGTATTANGGGVTSNLLTLVSVTGFAANSYASIAAAAPCLILAISGNTLLLATAQSWNNGDNVFPYTVGTPAAANPTVTTNSFGGTPAGGDVGTYLNCFFRATTTASPNPISDSPLFNMTIASSGAAPSFSAGPTLTSANTDGYTFGATSTQTGTIFGLAMTRGVTAPTATQIAAGSAPGSLAAFSVACTASVATSLSATGLTFPTHDVYLIAHAGASNSAVSAFVNLMKAAPAGKQYMPAVIIPITAITKANPAQVTQTAHGRTTGDYVELSNVGGMTQVNGFFGTITVVDANHYTLDGIDSTAFTTYTSGGLGTWGQSIGFSASTAPVTGDTWVADAASSPNGETVIVRPDGGLTLAANSSTLRQSVVGDLYSVSAQALLGVGTTYLDNLPPIPPSPATASAAPIILSLNQPASVNIAALFTSPQGDTLTMTASGLPTGLSMSTPNMVGTPTVRAITGASFTGTDNANESSSGIIPVIVGQIPVPSPLVGLDQVTISQLLAANFLGATFGSQNYPNALSPVAAGIALAVSPPENALVDPNTVISVTLSNGQGPASPTSLTPTSKSSQLMAEEALGALLSYQVFESFGTIVMGATDQPGKIYRFCRIPASARVIELQLMNDANPSGSSYRLGVLQPNGGGLIVLGSDSILLPSGTSLDLARPFWTNLYAPSAASTSSSVANIGKRIWELLGFSQDPSLPTQDALYDVCMTAITPGASGGNVAVRLMYLRAPDRGMIAASAVHN